MGQEGHDPHERSRFLQLDSAAQAHPAFAGNLSSSIVQVQMLSFIIHGMVKRNGPKMKVAFLISIVLLFLHLTNVLRNVLRPEH